MTAAGSRLLAQRLAAPLTDSAAIARRLDAIATFVADSAARDDIRTTLRAAPDMSRALARLSVGRGGPRDLAGLRDGILAADQALARLGATRRAAAGNRRRRWRRCAVRRAISRANSNARWPNNCR